MKSYEKLMQFHQVDIHEIHTVIGVDAQQELVGVTRRLKQLPPP